MCHSQCNCIACVSMGMTTTTTSLLKEREREKLIKRQCHDCRDVISHIDDCESEVRREEVKGSCVVMCFSSSQISQNSHDASACSLRESWN